MRHRRILRCFGVFAPQHDDGRKSHTRRAALVQAAEERGDEELVVGMRADPEDALRV